MPGGHCGGTAAGRVDRFSRRYPRVVVSVKAADDLAPDIVRYASARSISSRSWRRSTPRRRPCCGGALPRPRLRGDRRQGTLGAPPRCDAADLMEHPWLLFPENSWIDMRVNEAFRRCSVAPPRSIVRAYSVHFCINMLATDRFLASLAGSVLRFNAPRFGLKVLPINLPAQPWPVAMVTLKNRTLTPVVEEFMKDIRVVAKAMADQPL